MGTLYERFNGVNIWEKINNVNALPWIDIIVDTINILWLNKYKSRTCNLMCDLQDEQIAKVISNMFNDKWSNLFKLLYGNWYEKGDYNETTKETNAGKTSSVDITTNETVNSVVAFDSDDYANKDKESTTNNTQNNGTNDNEKIIEKQGNNNAQINYKIKYIDYLYNTLIYDMVFTDVNNLLTYNIAISKED